MALKKTRDKSGIVIGFIIGGVAALVLNIVVRDDPVLIAILWLLIVGVCLTIYFIITGEIRLQRRR